jgi:hypothetical protein
MKTLRTFVSYLSIQMKKIILITIAITYLFLSVGIRMNTHYCGDKISSVDFFFSKSKNCCGNGEIAKTCCKDKISYFKLSDNQKNTSVLIFSTPDFSEALVPAIDYSKLYLFAKQDLPVYTSSFFDSDIPLRKNPIYLINRSLRV